MKNTLVQKSIPHVLAIVIFLIVSLLFCKPALEGNVLSQVDVLGWKGIAQNAFDYKEKNGHFPLWNTNVFSGMPNYQIAMDGNGILPDLNKIFSLGLPEPVNYFFLGCVYFYILCMVLRLRPVVGILGSLAFAFSTYNPVILSAGHMTKMFAIIDMPLLLAGLILIFEKRYWLGLALTTLGAVLEIGSNHPQINYYFFLIAGMVMLGYLIHWIRQKDWKHIGIAAGVTMVAAITAVATCSFSFLIGSDYAKYTIRGGKNINIEGENVTAQQTSGLDTSYAFEYSFRLSEPLVALMPKAFGGSSGTPLAENSNVIKKLVDNGVPENSALQVAGSLPNYWGGLESTSGPAYMGAIVCILALIGFFIIRHPLKWGLLGASILAIMMSWGKFFPGFNVFLFEHLPAYNKFRAPSMSLVVVQLIFPIMMALAVQQLFFTEEGRDYLKKDFKKILYIGGGLIAFLGLVYVVLDYSSGIDQQILANKWDSSGSDAIGRAIVAGLKEDRSGMFGAQVLRTLVYVMIVMAAIWVYLKNTLKPLVIVAILAGITCIDLFVIGKKYLGEENYVSKDELESQHFVKTSIDEQILADKAVSYRVYNAGPNRFSASDFKVSVFHKAIGGYHAAKLRIYQDIIARYFSGAPNPEVLNMLNAKYIIAPNPQNGQEMLIPNPEAYGNSWFVKNIKLVKDDVEEIQAIGKTHLKDTAIVQQTYATLVRQPQPDSAATIAISKFDNDAIEYTSNSSTPQFAVFSEVFYPDGWNAYIDGQKVEYVRTNYVLRGLSVPPGQHTIRFVFEPSIVKKGLAVSRTGSILFLILVVGGFFMSWWKHKKAPM